MIFHWPQILWVSIAFLGIIYEWCVAQNQESRTKAGITTVISVLFFFVLYKGGFFAGCAGQ